MTVFEVKGQLFEEGPNVCGSEAEATVSNSDGKDLFVHAWCFEGCNGYTVSEKSSYGEPNGNNYFIESYDELSETTASEYYHVFVVLDQVLQLMEG